MDLDESLNDEYYQLHIGDIIFANRYTTEEEKLEIPDGHRIGPYVVIGKENNEFLCLYISGATPKFNSHYNTTLILDDINYDLNKISYIYLTKYTYISKDRFIKKFEYLNEIDTKMLFKKIDIIIKMGILNDININIPNIPLEIGDIINNNGQLYLIVNETNDIYQCIKMNKNIYEYDFLIKLDTIGYNFDFDNFSVVTFYSNSKDEKGDDKIEDIGGTGLKDDRDGHFDLRSNDSTTKNINQSWRDYWGTYKQSNYILKVPTGKNKSFDAGVMPFDAPNQSLTALIVKTSSDKYIMFNNFHRSSTYENNIS